MQSLSPDQKKIFSFLAIAIFIGYALTFGFTATTIVPLLTGVILSVAFYFIAKEMQEKDK